MKHFDGKHVLNTGGLGTIGRALAEGLLKAGGAVNVLDQPSGATLEGTVWLGLDLRGLKSASAAVTTAGPFNNLINNASRIINRPFEDFTIEDDEEQITLNLTADFALLRACSQTIKAKRRCRV